MNGKLVFESPEITSTSEFIPLIKQVGKFHKPKIENEKDVKDVTLQIYPNPTDGQTIIRLINGKKHDIGIKSISMYNAIGQQVLLTDTYNSPIFQFTATSFDGGLHLIQVQDTNNQLYMKKVIIQH